MLKLAVFIALATMAFFADRYLEKNPVQIAQTNEKQEQPADNGAAFIYYNPQSNISVKPIVPKAPTRFIESALHDKLLRQHHQLRNFFALKADNQNQKPPVQATFYILRHDYPSGSPDDPSHS